MEGEGDEIKSEQAINRDRTLIVVVKLGSILWNLDAIIELFHEARTTQF